MVAHLHNINRHHTTNKTHIALYNALGPDENVYETEEDLEMEIARIRTKLAAYFARKNLPPLHIDDLVPLILDVSQNRRALEHLALRRTTLTKIITNVMAPCVKQELFEKLCVTKFSMNLTSQRMSRLINTALF